MIVDGFSNHDWKQTSALTKQILEKSGLFKVDITTVPTDSMQQKAWKPAFEKYAVIIQNTNNIQNPGLRWGAKLDSTGFERKKYANLKFTYHFNTLDNPLFPRKGIRFVAGANYNRNLDEKEKQFVELFAEASTYFSAGHKVFL